MKLSPAEQLEVAIDLLNLPPEEKANMIKAAEDPKVADSIRLKGSFNYEKHVVNEEFKEEKAIRNDKRKSSNDAYRLQTEHEQRLKTEKTKKEEEETKSKEEQKVREKKEFENSQAKLLGTYTPGPTQAQAPTPPPRTIENPAPPAALSAPELAPKLTPSQKSAAPPSAPSPKINTRVLQSVQQQRLKTNSNSGITPSMIIAMQKKSN